VPRALALACVVAAVLVAALVSASGPRPEAAAQSSSMRIIVPFLSREVLPDVIIESIVITRTDTLEADYTYRIQNAGDAPADLSKFTMQAWFSTDAALDKGPDLEAGVVAFGVTLAPGAVLEASAVAEHPSADIATYSYLVLEIDSAGAVVESNTANNVRAVVRPPLDLVSDVLLAWDEPNERAIATWVFNGELYGLIDAGFRVEAPGFGTLEVPAGTRQVFIPFNPFTGERPCIVRVQPLIQDGGVWPAVESNRLCE
jgi:hypothetical protein